MKIHKPTFTIFISSYSDSIASLYPLLKSFLKPSIISIDHFHKKIDREKALICILLSHIGYMDYFNSKRIFSVSKKGHLLGYKILGINCLVSAYSLSALYLHGVNQGDQQTTIFALILSFIFVGFS